MVAGDEEYPDPTKYLFISLEQKRKDQTKPYDGKKMFWIPDDKECYVLASLVSEKDGMCTLELGREGGGEKVCVHFLTRAKFFTAKSCIFTQVIPEWKRICINMYYISLTLETSKEGSAATAESTQV